jgi:predicted ArsR family transcriptional regulator
MLWWMEAEDRRRRMSRETVLAALRTGGPASRSDLARRTGLSRPTVSSIIAELQAAGILDEADETAAGGAGRPAALVRLNRRAGVALGIDFGKRHLRVAIADLGHEVLAERSVELPFDHDAATGIERAADLFESLLAETGLDRSAVVGAAMGLPGPVTGPGGELGSSTILPGWVGVRAARP